MPNCDHIITTDPKLLEKDFPVLFDLCKNGAKYRVQTKIITAVDIYEAINSFCDRLDRKYRLKDNELKSFTQVLKCLITPCLIDLDRDYVPNIKPELIRLHKMYTVTQDDKDASSIAFVCKTITHKLTKNFIYGPCHNVSGLFELDPRSLDTVIATLENYSMLRRRASLKHSLPTFKIVMKMHKIS